MLEHRSRPVLEGSRVMRSAHRWFLVAASTVAVASGCAASPNYGNGSGGGGGAPAVQIDGPAGVAAMGPILGMALATFDSADADGFSLNTFPEATNLALGPTPATMTWVSTEGSPDPGCMKIVAPYSGPNQWVNLEAPSFAAPLPDWSGKTLHVRMKLEPGSVFSGSPRLYVKTGSAYVFYTTAFTAYPQHDGWQDFVLPLVSPAPVPPANPGADPRQVITYGIDPITAGAPARTPTPVTFYVDSFSIE